MRKSVLFIVLTSVLISLCIPASAQQERSDSTVSFTGLTADMIANVKAYVPSAQKIANNEYIIEVGSISKKSKSKNDPNKDKTSRVPVGTTVKELQSSTVITDNPDYTFILYFDSGNVDVRAYNRKFSRSLRPVTP